MTEPNPIKNLNKIFDHRLRLGIMSILAVNKTYSFNDLKDLLQVTDGNLASHIKILEENNYLSVIKGFIGRKPNTLYAITREGKDALKQHIETLAKLIDTMD
ncbi:MAG: transcriptional regulator [Prevotellaceae bacterium]|jgi:DNA-binding MarR family transcriptional regulator|nr:transcriptional regulator [Prevotellaceae bacterium]